MSDRKTTNRRQFFQQFGRRLSHALIYSAAASSLSPVFSSTTYGQNQRGSDAAVAKLRVIIVGAGIAGISAAVFLCQNGVLPENITILEGRDRIGGRIHSVDFAKNTVDLGASWIHGHNDNPIADLIGYGKQQKSKKSSVQQAIQVARTNYEDHTIYDDTGKQLSDDAVDALDARFDDLATRLADLRESFSQSTKSPSTSQNTGVHTLDLSLAEAIQQVTTPRERSASLQYSINTIIEHEYAADSSRLSFLSYDDDESVRGDDLLFLNGYRRIFDILLQKNTNLSRQISSQIVLQQTVTRIALARDGQIRVETAQTNQQTNVWTADVVISTLPVGVLQRAQQNNTLAQLLPDWSDEKNRALAGLSMGVLNKLFLRFPTPFWDTAQLLGYIDAQKKGFFAETLNLHAYTQEPMLLFFNAGTYGEETEKLTDQQLTDAAMQVLRKIYRKKAQDPTHMLRSRWGSDPFSYGSYAHIDVGGSKKSRIALAKPIFLPNSTSPSGKSARIFFAGEATHVDAPATVHGAYLSGIRAAREVLWGG